jgi:hypothetical protein
VARRYKIIIIILLCSLFTYLIFNINKSKKINIVALGDGIASGETAYNIDSISYNDYLKEYYQKYKILKTYNDSYAYKNNKIKELIDNINDNSIKDNTLNIKQLIHNANIITIALGEDELTKLCLTKDFTIDTIKEYIKNYNLLIELIKRISESKIILIGLYENKCLDKGSIIILNSELANISVKYNIIFLNINDMIINKQYYIKETSYYFNYLGHKEVFNLIVNSL